MNITAPNDNRNHNINIQADSIFVSVPTRQNLHNGDILLQKKRRAVRDLRLSQRC
jgi:hypothetical protein